METRQRARAIIGVETRDEGGVERRASFCGEAGGAVVLRGVNWPVRHG